MGSAEGIIIAKSGAGDVVGNRFGLVRRHRRQVFQRRMGRQATEVLALIGLNLVLGFVIPNIDWRAHIGGLVAGMVLTAALAWPLLVRLVRAEATARGRALAEATATAVLALGVFLFVTRAYG